MTGAGHRVARTLTVADELGAPDVVKSNRRRKQDRAKRRAGAAQRHAAAERRWLREEAIREAEQRVVLLRDPGTPVERSRR